MVILTSYFSSLKAYYVQCMARQLREAVIKALKHPLRILVSVTNFLFSHKENRTKIALDFSYEALATAEVRRNVC